jgi:hypothetical protein
MLLVFAFSQTKAFALDDKRSLTEQSIEFLEARKNWEMPDDQRKKLLRVASQRQLFIDDLFFETTHNVKLKVNPPRKTRERNVVRDKPWEDVSINYFNIMKEGDKFRMWYECYAGDIYFESRDSYLCYAESDDGINWVKPDLGFYPYRGTYDNNILFRSIGPEKCYSRVHGTGVFEDPTAPPEQRYKAVSQGMWWDRGNPRHRVAGMYSPDGLRWTRLPEPINAPVQNNPSDGMHTGFWDERISKYVIYRLIGVAPYARCQLRTESGDFTHFPSPSFVLVPEADDPPESDFYSMCARLYPYAGNVYFAFVSVYHHGPHSGPPGSKTDKLDIRLAVSRDGIRWTWPDKGSVFVANGAPGEFDNGSMYMGQGIAKVDDEIWQYYGGSPCTHSGPTGNNPQRLIKEEHLTYSRLISRLDGYVSVEAGPQGGYFVTPPLEYYGNQLKINVKVRPGGSVRIGLLDADNQPIEGRSLEECVPITSDDVNKLVEWKTGFDITDFANKPVKMRIEMTDAGLYAFEFEVSDQAPGRIFTK